MKPSEAMRKGCEVTNPVKGSFVKDCQAMVPEACAAGALLFGLGKCAADIWSGEATLLRDEFPRLFEGEIAELPASGPAWNGTLMGQIVFANDGLDWERERIADALEEAGL